MRILSGVAKMPVALVSSSVMRVPGRAVMLRRIVTVPPSRAPIRSFAARAVKGHGCVLPLNGVNGVSVKWLVNVLLAIVRTAPVDSVG